jgi:2,4-dienoyl-CoA reductase-like NADH-dependent reductase (Old Yellow Enzyme family)
VKFRARINLRHSHDETSIRRMLERGGATPEEAREIVEILSRRLSPDDMHVWLCDPQQSHPVPDPDSAKRFEDAALVPVVTNWTATDAVSAGKAHLVIDEARRYVAG